MSTAHAQQLERWLQEHGPGVKVGFQFKEPEPKWWIVCQLVGLKAIDGETSAVVEAWPFMADGDPEVQLREVQSICLESQLLGGEL